MFVRDYMTTALVTINKNTPVFEALEVMKEHRIRQLPVMEGDKLAGVVTEKDLLTVSPSPATSLSIYEINYLLAKMTVAEVMVTNPLTVTPETTIEEAALHLRERKIGSVPVVTEGSKLIGIITVTDIFDALINIFGYGQARTRLVVKSPQQQDLLNLVGRLLQDAGIPVQGAIYFTDANKQTTISLQLNTVETSVLESALAAQGMQTTKIIRPL
ncbi:MAG: CBS domain-containing protein [Heliobacteriaceae bacterium]|nr:CBS domain-containing protein [Heliobacteriaceae bacterium]MDD4588163.1 CBS domain-containing protein [Heliobacteriaceae bacterium]